MERDHPGALAGMRLGVTSGRKGAELAEALRRRGAEVLVGPMVGGDERAPDDDIVAATLAVIAARPTWLAASTGVGVRLWAEVAGRHGLLDDLKATVDRARIVARGDKARGGLKTLDARPEWVSAAQTDADVAAWLAERVETDDVVAVQLHGAPTSAFDPLEEGGATVVTIMPYRSVAPIDPSEANHLLSEVIAGRIDVLTFTSPAAARMLFALAEERGGDALGRLRSHLGDDVAVACVGPVTGQVFEEKGIPIAIRPDEWTTGHLIRAIEHWTASTRPTQP